jgi:hypothetical protein
MKYRAKSTSVKCQHGMIPGLRAALTELSGWEEVRSIIPGVIRPSKGPGQTVLLKVQYPTATGLKLLAKTGTAVQEVFVVTDQPAMVQERIQNHRVYGASH